MPLIVGGERIENSAIRREVERLRPHYERVFADKDPREREAQLLEWSRENVIEKVLLSQQAKKCGKQIPKPEVATAFEQIKRRCGSMELLRMEFGTDNEEEIKERIESHLRVERMLQDVCRGLPEPSEDDIREFYEANKKQFQSAEHVRVAHIVKHISGQTDEVAAHTAMIRAQNELKNGAVFETLVVKYSDCPDKDGDLGYIARGEMVEEFEDVVFNLGVGEVSEVFRTRFGFHMAKLYDRKPAATQPLKEARSQIVNELKEQTRREAIYEFVDQLRNRARIEEI